MRQKKDGGETKYGFDISKEIKGFEAEKSWGLNEVWIWLVERKEIEAEKRWGLDEVWICY